MREIDRFHADNMYHGYVKGMDMNSDSIIIDLGTYKGSTTKFLSDVYKSKIYTFEPMIQFAKEAIEACASHPNITVLQYGLGKGNFDFLMNIADDSTSMIASVNPDTAHSCSIRDFFEFLTENNITTIDLLHINIEGAEYDLLDYILSNNFQTKIRYLIVQFHYQSSTNDEKLKRYSDVLQSTHVCKYDYKYVWTKWERL